MNRTARTIATLAAAALLAGTLTGCDDNDEITPEARGPVNHVGQATCVYIDSPSECEDSGVPTDRWFKASDVRPESGRGADGTDDSDWLMQLFIWQMIYSQWYASPMYVDRYVVVEHRDAYRSRWKTFDQRYANEQVNYRKKAKYKNKAGEYVPPEKVNPKKFAPPKNKGGNTGNLCKVLRLTIAAPAPKPPQPKAPKPVQPKPPVNKPAVGGDKGKGGTAQHGC